jgi:hypothetical protein
MDLGPFCSIFTPKITPIQQKAVNKIQAKLKITQQESSI